MYLKYIYTCFKLQKFTRKNVSIHNSEYRLTFLQNGMMNFMYLTKCHCKRHDLFIHIC